MAATLLSDTSAAEGASHIVRLNLPGITARSGSSLDTHAHRSVLKPAGTASSWLNSGPTRLRTLMVVLINILSQVRYCVVILSVLDQVSRIIR